MKKLIFSCFGIGKLLFSLQLNAQVNTESLRIDSDKTVSMTAGGDVNYAFGNNTYFKKNGFVRSEFKQNSWTVFGTARITRSSANDRLYEYKGFAHVRSQYDFSKRVSAESFLQREFDDFLLLLDRNLAGGGMRFSIFHGNAKHDQSLDVKLGVGAMTEYESYSDALRTQTTLVRSTNYVRLIYKFSKTVQLGATNYFQFAVSRPVDYRILSEIRLDILIGGGFSFTSHTNYRYDSDPMPGIARADLRTLHGITYSFSK